MNINVLSEEEQKEFKRMLRDDRISMVVFTLFWNAVIIAVFFPALIADGLFRNMELTCVAGCMALVGVFMIGKTIYKIFFCRVHTYIFTRGLIIDKWSKRTGSGDNKSRKYYADIQLENGMTVEHVKITKWVYRNSETAVALAMKNNKPHYVIQVRQTLGEMLSNLFTRQ